MTNEECQSTQDLPKGLDIKLALEATTEHHGNTVQMNEQTLLKKRDLAVDVALD